MRGRPDDVTGQFWVKSGAAGRFVLRNGRQGGTVGGCFWQVSGMPPEHLEQFLADEAAFPADGVVHPDPLAAGINPATTSEVGQVSRYRGLGQLEHRHQVADTQFPLGLEEQYDAEADRIGKRLDGLGEVFYIIFRSMIQCI